MVGPKQNIAIVVAASKGTLPSSHAVSVGLIVTELIMNAIKYAFPKPRTSARIRVTFEKAKSDWKLTVSDNGVGRSQTEFEDLDRSRHCPDRCTGEAARGSDFRDVDAQGPRRRGDPLDV